MSVKVTLARWTDCQGIGEACTNAVLNISKVIVHNGVCCLLYNTVFTWTYEKWVQPRLSVSVSHGSKSLHKSSEL